jgi:predicted membrane channel-forming protein YqfA (hemolysin III family)
MGYEYSLHEKLVMAFITGVSNFACIPGLVLMILIERPFEFYIGLLTMISSFMYHLTESLDVNFYMEPGKWHELDNIGSICCINSLLLSMNNSYRNHPRQLKFNLFSLCLVMIMQGNNPWDLLNTFFPILIFALILIYDYIKYGVPWYNYEIMAKGVGLFIIAISMFIKGLDEHNDYLRVAHSIWHILIGIATFYLWQIQEKRLLNFKQVFVETYHKYSNIHN